MKIILTLTSFFCIGVIAHAAEPDPQQPPNVILLLADDLGWTGLSSFGSEFYETPNLNRLAADGMKFTDAYAACTVCSPTRASIMTGMYPARLHLTDFIAGQNRPWAKMKIPQWTKHLEPRHVTLAEALKAEGYRTEQVGKWHLAPRGNSRSSESPRGNPVDHGFDGEFLRPPQAKGYRLPEGFNESGESHSDYLTDYLTDHALEVIDQNKDQPFFLYFAYHVPHTPIQGRRDLVEYYSNRIDEDAEHDNPEFAAMVSSMDQSVGRILERLRRHRIDDRTIVIFFSDNGGLTQRYGKIENFTSNAPLRRGKGSAYEGGVRVPAIVRWPGVTAAGSVCDEPVMTIDLYPTILSMTGVSGVDSHNRNVDGVDLTPLLKNPSERFNRDLFWHYPHYHAGGDGPYSAIRRGEWKLIEFHEDDKLELYNLEKDLSESNNVVLQHPQMAQQLLTRLHQWRQEVDAQMPKANENYDRTRASEVKR